MARQNTTLAYLALATGLTSISLTAILIRWADAPETVTMFYRMVVASILLLPVFVRQQVRQASSFRPRWWLIAVLGGFFAAWDQGIYSVSLGHTRIANASLINNIAPLWVALFSWLLWKQRLTGKFWWGLLLVLGGATVVLGTDVLTHPQLGRGDFLALLSSFGYAGYFLAGQSGRRSIPALSYLYIMTITSAVLMGLWNISQGYSFGGYSPRTILIFIAAGVVTQALGHFSLSYSLGRLPASVVSSTAVLTPVITALLAIPLANEPLGPTQLIGGAVTLLGIYLVNRQEAAPVELRQVEPAV